MSEKQRREEATVWENKRAKIEAARTKRGLDAGDAGADINEISNAMAAYSKSCDEDSTDSEENIIPTPPTTDIDDEHKLGEPSLTDEGCIRIPLLPRCLKFKVQVSGLGPTVNKS